MTTERRCWCEHLERWHDYSGMCLWCARREAKTGFNFDPRHPFALEIPWERKQAAADALGRMLKGAGL